MTLILDNVSKAFGDFQAVDQMSLSMKNGVYGLLGVNGAGKTTLMRLLSTIMRPTSGRITYKGRDIFEMGAGYRALIGYLPQDFGYYPDLKVQDYLMYIASIKGIRTPIARKRIHTMLRLVGMEGERSKKMKALSGGMKRRVGIAQAVLNDPEILILDEPTAGLDPKETIRFRNLIGRLAENRIVLLSTHIVADIEAIANQVFLMNNGKILVQGSVQQLCESMKKSAWICRLPEHKAGQAAKHFQIINMHREGSEAVLRVLSEEMPVSGAVRAETTLEDVFLYYFGEEAGDYAEL